MKPILVSIIIPCYNVEDYVLECLEAALQQSYRPIEIIAVDNNSTDQTLSILKEYEQKYPDLITVLVEKKQGAPAARNTGMSVAKGEWLQFLDADDILLSEKIKTQIDIVRSTGSNNAMVVGSYIDRLTNGCNKCIAINETNDLFGAIILNKLGYTSSNLFYRKKIMEIGGWNEELAGAQDTDLIFRTIASTKGYGVLFDKSMNTVWRERPFGQITRSNPLTFALSGLFVRQSIMEYLKINFFDYYIDHKSLYEDVLYGYICRVASYDANLANAYRLDILGDTYTPKFRKGIISRPNSFFFRFFGFGRYVKIRHCVKFLFKTLYPEFLRRRFQFKKETLNSASNECRK